jgi:hypothetical protein
VTSTAAGLHAAALILEEDVRKIDAGELEATPAQRAFLAGAAKGLKLPGSVESSGLPVDDAEPGNSKQRPAPRAVGLDGGRPENTGLAERSFAQDGPLTSEQSQKSEC